jgi:hypothetical protein
MPHLASTRSYRIAANTGVLGKPGNRGCSGLAADLLQRWERSLHCRAANGKLLWHFNAGQSWKACPITYMVHGRQFIGMAARSTIMTFALVPVSAPPSPAANRGAEAIGAESRKPSGESGISSQPSPEQPRRPLADLSDGTAPNGTLGDSQLGVVSCFARLSAEDPNLSWGRQPAAAVLYIITL